MTQIHADLKQPPMNANRSSTGRPLEPLAEGALTEAIIGAFFAVYNELGFGFLESVYVRALQIELKARGIRSQREAEIEVFYRGEDAGYFRIDLYVERRVIVEVKTLTALAEPERKQLLNYLRATKTEVGLLLNFGPKARFMRMVFSKEARRQRRLTR